MSGSSQVSLAQYTWAQWKREALTAGDRARRLAWIAFGVVTAAVVAAGWANVEGTWRYSVIVYAPVAGAIVFGPATRLVMRSTFRTTGAAMRYRLVPSLVAHATDAQLAELAARNAVTIGGRTLQAVDTGKEVIVSSGRVSGRIAGTEVIVGDLDASGFDGWGDAGGGFGGGGGGDGGGG